jgi:hypothetical protein
MKRLRFATGLIAACLLAMPTYVLGEDDDCDGSATKADINALNSSGLSGTATLCLNEDGARAGLRVNGTTSGHAYTAWFFYIEGNNVVVNRFDSALAEGSTTRFAARVGGIAPKNGGSEIDLVIVDHGNVSGLSSFARAVNVLTPAGKPFSAIAVFKP